MNKNTGTVFHDLMKKGWIDREANPIAWGYYQELEIKEELDILGEEMHFEIFRAGDRIYLVPTQDNDLFLKNNVDYRNDIGDTAAKVRDLYLLNYMAIYMLFIFFKGDGSDMQIRDFITKQEFVEKFTEHCKQAVGESIEDEEKFDNGEAFEMLAEDWLAKTDGSIDSKKMSDKYGALQRLIIKFSKDDLFIEQDEQIKPTRKIKDLMPYFLRKERINEIQEWLEEGRENATDN